MLCFLSIIKKDIEKKELNLRESITAEKRLARHDTLLKNIATNQTWLLGDAPQRSVNYSVWPFTSSR